MRACMHLPTYLSMRALIWRCALPVAPDGLILLVGIRLAAYDAVLTHRFKEHTSYGAQIGSIGPSCSANMQSSQRSCDNSPVSHLTPANDAREHSFSNAHRVCAAVLYIALPRTHC